MRLDMSQQMKMDQRMVLAPRMIQSMEILQLPLLELQERIEQELLSNPMLEIEEPEAPAADQAPESEQGETSLLIQDGPRKPEDFERLNNSSSELGDYLGSKATHSAFRGLDEWIFLCRSFDSVYCSG